MMLSPRHAVVYFVAHRMVANVVVLLAAKANSVCIKRSLAATHLTPELLATLCVIRVSTLAKLGVVVHLLHVTAHFLAKGLCRSS